MAREIKFRAWNIDKKIMCYNDEDNSGEYLDGIKSSEVNEVNNIFNPFGKQVYIWMQFTGLKDKNGKSIFEGDIIINKLDINDVTSHDGVSTVTWEEGAFYARGNNHCNLAGGYFSYFEVIGNIYENPNLIV